MVFSRRFAPNMGRVKNSSDDDEHDYKDLGGSSMPRKSPIAKAQEEISSGAKKKAGMAGAIKRRMSTGQGMNENEKDMRANKNKGVSY